MHKGFKCLEVSSGRVYISRDVVFDESEFPFSKLHSNVGAHLREEISLLPFNLLNPPESEQLGGHVTNLPDDSDNSGENSNENRVSNTPDMSTRGTGQERAEIGVELGGSLQAGHSPAPGLPPNQPRLPSRQPAVQPAQLDHPGSATSPQRTAAAREGGTTTAADESGVATTSDAHDGTAGLPQEDLPDGSSAAMGAGAFGSTAPAAPTGVADQQMRPRTRLHSGICKEKVYTDDTIKYGLFTSSDEPRNLEESLNDKNWKEAMDSEYMALMKNKTWHLVPPRKGINVVDCKWVWKKKYKSDGSLDKYKGRLVAKGYKQRY
jgi:hypothetical protein